MGQFGAGIKQSFLRFPLLRALRHRDFLVLWLGALFSFLGGQVQGVAQGYWVYDITGSEAKLAMVMFAFTLPVMLLAPVAGVVADRFDRRMVLIGCVFVLAAASGSLAVLYALKSLEYWHVLASAAVNGVIQTVEAPTRQSIVRSCVSEEDLPAAIPAQAMTFNLARIAGPALGGFLLARYGVLPCFVVNTVSFSFLVLSMLLIKRSLMPSSRETAAIKDLVLEGMKFTFRSRPLRTLFLMEGATSIFGMFYLSLLPAIARSQLGLDKLGLGIANSCIGIGAMTSLITLSALADKPIKALLARIAMTMVGVCVLALGLVKSPVIAFPLLALTGAAAIVQFNTTNTLFQLMSPEALRGRVIAMHLWAISGLAPLGIFTFGWISETVSLGVGLSLGGALLLGCSVWAWTQSGAIPEPQLKEAGAA